MEVKVPHRWDLTPKEAAQLQIELRPLLKKQRDFGEIQTVAGATLLWRLLQRDRKARRRLSATPA